MKSPAAINEEGMPVWEQGTQKCGDCKRKDNVSQYQFNDNMKGLPVTKIAFLCKRCAVKQGLPLK